MKKKIIAFLLQFLLLFEAACVFAEGATVYSEDFNESTIASGMGLHNEGFYTTQFEGGLAGKDDSDTSLMFGKNRTADSAGSSIYTQIYASLYKKYFKYELNFMPGSADFSSVKFTTSQNYQVSPELYCTDAGTGDNYVLGRYNWNRIVYIVENPAVINKSSSTYEGKVDLYVNGKMICSGAAKTFNKDKADSTTLPLRFSIYGVNTTENDTTVYPALNTYIDDIEFCRYDDAGEFNVKPMPALLSGSNVIVEGSECTVIGDVTKSALTAEPGAAVTVFENGFCKNKLEADEPLSDGNVISVRDRENQISYYTVKEKQKNIPEITQALGKVTATAYLQNSVMVLAGYDEDGMLLAANTAKTEGSTTMEISGDFDVAKAFIFESLSSLKPIVMKELKEKTTIACWGDSLTEGDGCSDFSGEKTKSYPGVLQSLTGCDVYNMGVSGESAMTIAARQGAINILLEKDVIIPADTTKVTVSEGNMKGYDKDNTTFAGPVVPRKGAAWSPCTIAGIEGTLEVSVDTSVHPRVLNWAKFTRTKSGAEAVQVSAGTRIYPPARTLEIAKNADINVFFIGTNGVWNSKNSATTDADAPDLVSLITKMIRETKNKDKYIVVGLTTRGKDDWVNTNKVMKEAFGEHLILPKERLATEEVLIDNGIEPTAADIEDIEAGKIPSSLRKVLSNGTIDTVHLNDIGYAELAKLIYAKMIELNY